MLFKFGFKKYKFPAKSRGRSVSIVTMLWAEQPRFHSW